jgi:hypothetical protein
MSPNEKRGTTFLAEWKMTIREFISARLFLFTLSARGRKQRASKIDVPLGSPDEILAPVKHESHFAYRWWPP